MISYDNVQKPTSDLQAKNEKLSSLVVNYFFHRALNINRIIFLFRTKKEYLINRAAYLFM